MNIKNHFDDCPYGCNKKGMLLDSNLGQMVPCPHCSEKKKALMRNGVVETEDSEDTKPLASVLGIENPYLSSSFVYDSIVPDGERLFIEEDSLDWQSQEAEELYLGLSIGELPEESLCFGISIKGSIDKFAYPMLAKAYLGGLSVGRFLSCSEFSRLSFDVKNDLSDLYSSDFVMMLINDGCNASDLSCAKGLMQTRANKGKPTVFISTWTIEACSGLLGFRNESSLYLAKPIFLEYKKSKQKGHSSYINGLIGVENETLVEPKEQPKGISMADLSSI